MIWLFQSNPLVRGSILALSASHLRHVSPDLIDHQIAEYFHKSLALHDYQCTLEGLSNELRQSVREEFLLSAVFLNMLALALPDTENVDPANSWVFSSRPDRMGWLVLQGGLRPLTIALVGQNDGLAKALDFLGKILLGPGRDLWTSVRRINNLEMVPKSWVRLFELDSALERRAMKEYVFWEPVMVLARFRLLEVDNPSVIKIWAFLSKIKPGFRELLYNKDERAMWVFGYWLGLMQRFVGLWWCEKRIRMDYQAVRAWLRGRRLVDRPGLEGQLWRDVMMDLELVPVGGTGHSLS